jgi:hypothetical protein
VGCTSHPPPVVAAKRRPRQTGWCDKRNSAAKKCIRSEPSRLESSDPMREAGVSSTVEVAGAVRAVVPAPPGVVMVAPQTAPHNILAVKAT